MPEVTEGCRVLHDGKEDFKIVSFKEHRGIKIAKFENERYSVSCNAAELTYWEEEDTWFLPGRILSRAERLRFMELLGSRTPPTNHVSARKVLKVAGLLDTSGG